MKTTHKHKIISIALAAALALSFAACGAENHAAGGDEEKLQKITLCLDWTPNTNHTGLFAADALGYFEEEGLDVRIVQPIEDGATALCAAGQVEFAVTAQDSLAAVFSREAPLPVTAVAALLQHNTSGIISRFDDNIATPSALVGHTYSTWNSPIELAMMETVVEADGGDFGAVNLIPNNISDEAGALREKQTDAIWVYYGWGGISAELSDLAFNYLYFKDLDSVFDYYTPVLIANDDFLSEQPEVARAFLRAAKKGYEYAIAHPEAAAQILIDSDTTGSLSGSEKLVMESQKWMAEQYTADAPRWGYIDPDRWNAFYEWLNENDLVENAIAENCGFSNDFLPQ